VEKTATVLELKAACVEQTKLKETEMNLVFKGRILVDTNPLAEYNIQNDHTIILVKKFSETKKEEKQETNTTTTTNTNQNTLNTNTSNQDAFNMGFNQSGMGMGGMDMGQLSQMMNNPQYMNMMSEMMNDPNTMNMIMNSPQLKPLLDSNPQMRQMLQNPQMMQMLMNPQNMQNAMNMMQSGGLGQGGLGQQGFGQQGFGQNLSSNTQTNTTTDIKVLYKDQNLKMKDMGFTNDELNLECLKQTSGNVDAAVERLLNLLN